MKQAFKIVNTGSYKIGMNEIKGLENAITEVLKPVYEALDQKQYWNDLKFQTVEYLRRDGFIPHAHNCGGLELNLHVPKCESHNFGFLEFGECDDPECCSEGDECSYESEGHLDAFMRVRLKFEGIGTKGELKFYLFLEGGNSDAPYFRNLPTLFETEFSCKSVAGLPRAASKHIKALLKVIEGK